MASEIRTRHTQTVRYSSVAVGLHWLIAASILGLIVLGKVSHSLDTDDPLRFSLVQWHKSFGIAVMMLVVLRILWRFTHKPPALPGHMNTLERLAASLGHLGLYGLMLAIPLSGWAMVSASPLNLATELFGLIPWPHIPTLTTIVDREVWEYRFSTAHHWLANGLIVLIVVHATAALRHQYWLRDGLLSRMSIAPGDQAAGLLFGMLIGAAGVIGLFTLIDRNASVQRQNGVMSAPTTAALSEVGFSASNLGEPINGVFADHRITLTLDESQPDKAELSATVFTGSVDTGDSQIDATVVTGEWFAAQEHPQALFESTRMSRTGDGIWDVSGVLTIRGVAQDVTFQMLQQGNAFSGEVVIDRRDFGIGTGGQDEFVAPQVTINFSFEQ